MAGQANTNAFSLGVATVMIGPQADLFKLNPSSHSIGLVKNVVLSQEVGFVDLTQGITSDPVFSVKNSNKVKVAMEVFEYTAKNLAYGLQLDGTTLTPQVLATTLKTGITGLDATPVVNVVVDAATDTSANYPIGGWVMIHDASGQYDNVHVGKIATAGVYNSGTAQVSFTLATTYGMKTGTNFPVGSRVRPMYNLNLGSTAASPYFACKIVGIMPDNNQAIPIYLPKIRITKGFDMGFKSDNFSNMPFEIDTYKLVTTDAFYTDFGGATGFLIQGN